MWGLPECHAPELFSASVFEAVLLQVLRFWVLGLGFGVLGLGFRVWGLVFRDQGLGFRVWGSGFGAQS